MKTADNLLTHERQDNSLGVQAVILFMNSNSDVTSLKRHDWNVVFLERQNMNTTLCFIRLQ